MVGARRAPMQGHEGSLCRAGLGFDYMCVKNNADIVDKSRTKTSQTGEPLKINVVIVATPCVRKLHRTHILTICKQKRM